MDFSELGIEYFIKKIKPKTLIGLECRNTIRPFLPKEEHLLIENLDFLNEALNIIKYFDKLYEIISLALINIGKCEFSIDYFHHFSRKASKLKKVFTETGYFLEQLRNMFYRIVEHKDEEHSFNLPILTRLTRKAMTLLDYAEINNFELMLKTYKSRNFNTLKNIEIKEQALKNKIESEYQTLRAKLKETVGIVVNSYEFTLSNSDAPLVMYLKNLPYLKAKNCPKGKIKFTLLLPEKSRKLLDDLQSLKQQKQENLSRFNSNLSVFFHKTLGKLKELAQLTSFIDLTFAKAELKLSDGLFIPYIAQNEGAVISGVKKFLKEELSEESIDFVSLKNNIHIVTAATGGGKSTLLKTIAAIQVLCQSAIPVPAKYIEFFMVNGIKFLKGKKTISNLKNELLTLANFLKSRPASELIVMDDVLVSAEPFFRKTLLEKIINELKLNENTIYITGNMINPENLPEALVISASTLKDNFSEINFNIPAHGSEQIPLENLNKVNFPVEFIAKVKRYSDNNFYKKENQNAGYKSSKKETY